MLTERGVAVGACFGFHDTLCPCQPRALTCFCCGAVIHHVLHARLPAVEGLEHGVGTKQSWV